MILMAIRDQQKIWWWTRLEDLFKRYCMRWLELLIARDQLAPVDLQHQDIRSILVVRQHDQLGDFLVSIPALYALREQYPHAEISLLVREYFADVARCIPCIDEVIVFQEDARRWRLRKIIAFLRQLRRRRNLAIVLTTVSHSLTSDLLAHWSRAEYVLGSADRVFSGCRRNFLYNLNAPSRPLPRHQTQRNLDIVRYLGIEVDRVVGAIVVPDSTVDEARGFLRGRGPEPSLPIVGMHLGAGKPENRWPVESFAELARQVRTKYNATIALFWGPGEEGLCDAFSRQIAFEPIRVGHPSLLNLAAVFRLGARLQRYRHHASWSRGGNPCCCALRSHRPRRMEAPHPLLHGSVLAGWVDWEYKR